MAGLGNGLMSASPSGPVQLRCGRGQLLAQPGEQPADLVTGQRDQLIVAGVVVGWLAGGQDGQERAGEQGQDGPTVPGGPAADLVFVEGGWPFLLAAKPSSIFLRALATMTRRANDGTGPGARAR